MDEIFGSCVCAFVNYDVENLLSAVRGARSCSFVEMLNCSRTANCELSL